MRVKARAARAWPARRSSPCTAQPSASRRSAIARPMPLLLPVTTTAARERAARETSLDTDVALGDDLLRARHVVALELDEVVDRCPA